MLKPTAFTDKLRLRFAVPLIDVFTLRAFLRSVAWVNIGHLTPVNNRFVFQKAFQSRKAPRMDSAPLLLSRFDALTNVGEIFQCQQRTFSRGCHQAFRQNMVTVGAEAVDLLRDLFQVSLCRWGAFRLKFTLQSEVFSRSS